MRKQSLYLALSILSLALSGAAAQAACTVPNALTNGSLASAGQVMANFNAVANCVNDAPVGSPGAIQLKSSSGTFSGVGPLTDGQVLIGSSGNDPQPSTLTAGPGVTITNAPGAITIGTSSAVATGLYDISMGVPTAFTPVNIGGNSSVVTNGNKAISIVTGASSPPKPTIYGVAIPVPTSTPYMVAVLAVANFPVINYSGVTVGFYDSTTGKIVSLSSLNGTIFNTPGYSFGQWVDGNNRSTYSEPALPRSMNFGPTWFGIKDDGTTISFYVSQDGANFYPLGFTQTKAGGYLTAYDHIFLGIFNDAEPGSQGSLNNYASVSFLAYDPNGLSRVVGP